MKRVILYITILLFIISPIKANAIIVNNSDYETLKVYYFCDNDEKCKDGLSYLNKLENKQVRLLIENIDVRDDTELYQSVKDALSIKKDSYPLVVIGSNYFTTINESKIEKAIDSYLNSENSCDLVARIKNKEEVASCFDANKNIYKDEYKVSNILVIIISSLVFIIIIAGIVIILKKKK